MMSLLNAISLLDAIMKVEFLTSILLGALGFAVICLAKRVTKTVRRTNFISSDDKLYIALKLIGVALIVVAFIILFIVGVSAY